MKTQAQPNKRLKHFQNISLRQCIILAVLKLREKTGSNWHYTAVVHCGTDLGDEIYVIS